MIFCIHDFDADPFDKSAPALYSLRSGITESPEVLEDLWNALEEREKQSNDILERRVFSKELSLKAKVTKNKRLNLATTPINVTKTYSNPVKTERNALSMMIDEAEKNDVISLELVLVKRISEECLTMFNPNGSMRKTAKSKLLQSFPRQPLLEVPSAYVSLVDMGLIWRLAFPTSGKRDPKIRSGIDYL